jgi:CheY-like chemotaxis protein
MARIDYDNFKTRIVEDAKNGNLDDGWAILWSDSYGNVANEVRPTAVEDAEAALQVLEAAKSGGQPFPLLLLDGQMPGMDGLRSLLAGMDAYVSKPIQTSELFGTMERLLDLRTKRAASDSAEIHDELISRV